MTELTVSQMEELRAEFPPAMVGKLPKGGATLDYVGHGAVTDRLLKVDPAWSWEPFALDEHGLPALDEFGNLWIRLTVGGITRIGVGDGPSMKILIGDAIRNAAMRFGVALDLWIKGHAEDDDRQNTGPIRRNAPTNGGGGKITADLRDRATTYLNENPKRKDDFLVAFGSKLPAKVDTAHSDAVEAFISSTGATASTGDTSAEGEAGADDATGASPAPAPKYANEEPF
jgi:hypothetical protein